MAPLSRPKRFVAGVAVRAERRFSQLKSRLLVDIPSPTEDPFYRTTEDLHDCAPGQILDHRRVEIRRLRHVIDVDAWQVRFRSADTTGEPTPGIATVMVPRHGPRHEVRPLLSYQIAIDALGATADPSYTLRRGDQLELPFVARALRRGWAVVSTDFNGPQHAFSAHPLIAQFVLDGIRAAVALGPADLDATTTPIGLWGYSGGALATLSAVERHPSYAPELNIVGAAAGGAGVNPSSQMFEAGDFLSGIPFCAVIGMSRGLPGFDLDSALTPRGRAMVKAAADMTLEQLVASFCFVRCSDVLTVPGVLHIPGFRAALETNGFGRATPRTPMHLYHAIHDKYPQVGDVDELVEHYRCEGVDVTYRRHRVGGHLTVAFTARPAHSGSSAGVSPTNWSSVPRPVGRCACRSRRNVEPRCRATLVNRAARPGGRVNTENVSDQA